MDDAKQQCMITHLRILSKNNYLLYKNENESVNFHH